MDLQEIIAENSQKILDAWVEQVMNTYHAEGARFFTNQKDRFANPVGYNLKKGLEGVFNTLRKCEEVKELPIEMVQFIKLRAVQESSPSAALSFLYGLKEIVRNVCGVEQLLKTQKEWVMFDKAVDQLALLGFDDYMKDRELLYKAQVNDFKRGNNVMTKRQPCPSAMMNKNKDVKKELQVILDS
jgi:hypothetical protein